MEKLVRENLDERTSQLYNWFMVQISERKRNVWDLKRNVWVVGDLDQRGINFLGAEGGWHHSAHFVKSKKETIMGQSKCFGERRLN